MKKRGKEFLAPASLLKRMSAFIIDLLLLDLIILFPFNSIFDKIIKGNTIKEQVMFIQNNPLLMGKVSFIFLITGIIATIYFSYFEYKIKQTPGKLLFNIFTISEIEKPKFIHYLTSNLFLIPIFPFYLLWFIEPIYAFMSPKNQRLTEKISKILTLQKYKY